MAQAAILFHVAGEKWTVPSVGWENTSLSLFAGDWEACANNVKRIYGAVDRLRPKMVVGTECGHAHRATVVEGPYWAGREDGKPPVPFLHYVEWLADALRKGKIKIDPAKRLKMPVTLQDSCNYIRNHGLAEHTRYIMSQIAEDFREMKCNREDNFCCGGGGGFNGIGKFRPQRDKGLYMKLPADPRNRRQDGHFALPQLLGRHPRYDGSVPCARHQVELPQAHHHRHDDRPRSPEAAG